MPKEPLKLKYIRFCKEFGSDIFTWNQDSNGKLSLYCQPCNCAVNPNQRSQMNQHVERQKHKDNLGRWNRSKQITITQMNDPKDQFNKELCNWMVVNNIALSKFRNKSFTDFLVKNMNKPISGETNIRSQLNYIFEEKMNQIRDYLYDNYIWLSIDECTSSDGRCVANVVIGTMKAHEENKVFLVNSIDMKGQVNNAMICQIVDETIKLIWKNNFDRKKFLLLITDGAHYMKLAGVNLKAFYPNLVHVTCIAHLINRLAEFIKNNHKLTDILISETKKIFSKSRSRIEIFNKFAPELSLPPKPVITRWSTWLNAAFYYAKNYEIIIQILEKFHPKDAICIQKVQKLIKKSQLKIELSYILSNFQFFTEILTKIQSKSASLEKSIELFQEFEAQLLGIKGDFGEKLSEKYYYLINKNGGLNITKNIYQIQMGINLETKLTRDQIAAFKYAPITSCEVERTFSMYKFV